MIHLKFIGFNAIKFLQSENIFVLTEALQYHKQLSTSLIVVGDIIIGKSFDKLVKATDVKVSTKRWCDGSQTPTVRRVWHGLPDGIKPLPEPMLTNHQWGLHPRKTSEEMLKISSLSMNLKLINLRLQLNLSGANDLTHYGLEMAT